MSTAGGRPSPTKPPHNNFSGKPDSHILKLSRDILWNIFLINTTAQASSQPALLTLKDESQVCSSWRDIIVNSPSLWGRVIDVFYLGQDLWREEVLRRTGSSAWLYVDVWNDNIEDIAIHILEENWHRVRSLDIEQPYSDPRSIFDSDSRLWPLLQRPAPVLARFRTTNPEIVKSTILSLRDFRLFNDDAPMLTMLSAPGIHFSLQAPWISGLCHLALSSPVPYHELLTALTHMPLLQVLEDSRVNAIIDGDPTKVTTPRLTLPRLTKINIETTANLGPYVVFLNHLTPKAGRCLELNFTVLDLDCLPNPEVLVAATQVLSTQAKYANLAEATKVDLVLKNQHFSFIAWANADPVLRFTLDQSLTGHSFPAGTLMGLLSALGFSKPSLARNLSLDICLNGYDLSASHPKIIEFMVSLNFVQVLTVSLGTFSFLHKFSNEVPETVLPQLRSLSAYNGSCMPVASREVSNVHAFLVSRLQRGTAIPALSLLIDRFSSGDFQCLEDILGLKVEIPSYENRDVVYTCGSGTPEVLLVHSR